MTLRIIRYDYDTVRAWVAADGGASLAARAAAIDLDQLDLDELRARINAITCARSLLHLWGDKRHEEVLRTQELRLEAAARTRRRAPCACGLANEAKCVRRMMRRKMASGWAIYPYCDRRGSFCGGAAKKEPGWQHLPEAPAQLSEVGTCAACEADGPLESHHVAPRARFGLLEAERWPRVEVCRSCHMQWHEWEHDHAAQPWPASEAEGGLCEICDTFARVVHRSWFDGIGKIGASVRSWVCRGCWDRYEAKMDGYVWRSGGSAGGGR